MINETKDKKGFIFGIIPLLWMFFIIVILILLIWFGVKINEGLVAIFEFLKKWWWAIGLSIFGLLWFKQIQAVVNAILKKFGVKV